jgi:restriction endonuclease Mrr
METHNKGLALELDELHNKLRSAPNGAIRRSIEARIQRLNKKRDLESLEERLASTPDRYPYLRKRLSLKIENLRKEILAVEGFGEPNRGRVPTSYEKELMESLGFQRLEDLEQFLNLPPLKLGMHPPDEFYEAQSREDRWIDDHCVEDQAAVGDELCDILSLSGRDFEQLIVGLLSRMGFKAELTAPTGDGGVDVVATLDKPITGGRYLIQCKRYGSDNTIGAPAVRDFYGAVTADRAVKGIFITTSDFTVQARQFAEKAGVELVNLAGLKKLLTEYSLPSLGQ